jgi:putative hydrolase of the HAD superfamily
MDDKMTLRAIIFDLDGTLRGNQPRAVDVFYDTAARLGAPDSQAVRQRAERWTHAYWAQSPELERDLKFYEGHEDLFWLNFARRHLVAMGVPAQQAARIAPLVSRTMRDEYRPQDTVPADVPGTLAALRRRGLRLGLVTNRDKPVGEYLNQLGIADYFDLALAGGEVDLWKPDPALFHYAAEKMGVRPDETVYVGDNFYADMVGAQRAGMRAILIDPFGVFPEPGVPVIETIGELLEM